MTATATRTDGAQGRLIRPFLAIWTLVVGTLLCLTPATALVALGWLQNAMRRTALRRAGLALLPGEATGWLRNRDGQSVLDRTLGGLAQNIRAGIAAAVALFAASFPATVLWLTSWWAGWENSFNKGYEQAAVGPIVGLTGVAVFMVAMTLIPIALAHQAVEGRAFSFFEFRRVRSAMRHAGWRYTAWTVASLILALPLFAARGLPVFAEGISPGIADMSATEIADLRQTLNLIIAAYVFVSLVFLRRWLARVYAVAAIRAASGPDRDLWQGSRLFAASDQTDRRPWRLIGALRLSLIALIWGAVAFLIFFGQFLNHEWHIWMTHPFFLLPWWH